jgi:hypothetical protein
MLLYHTIRYILSDFCQPLACRHYPLVVHRPPQLDVTNCDFKIFHSSSVS